MPGRKKGVPKRKKGVAIPVALAEELEAYSRESDVPENRIVSLALTLLFRRDPQDLKGAIRSLKEMWTPADEER